MSVIGDVESEVESKGERRATIVGGIEKTRVSLKLLHLHKRFKDCGVNIVRKFMAEAHPRMRETHPGAIIIA